MPIVALVTLSDGSLNWTVRAELVGGEWRIGTTRGVLERDSLPEALYLVGELLSEWHSGAQA